MKEGMQILKSDLKRYGCPIMLFLLAYLLLNLLFKSVCFSVILFGIPCPACGMTRAIVLLFQGRFTEALCMNPLVPFVVAFFIYFTIMKYLLKKAIQNLKFYGIISMISAFIVYLYRMKVYFPYREPMVYWEHNLLALLKVLWIKKML